MANQPEHTPKGQWSFNTGAKPPARVVTKQADPSAKPQNMKRIAHNAKLSRHNSGMKGK
jgi:hypothetical protein